MSPVQHLPKDPKVLLLGNVHMLLQLNGEARYGSNCMIIDNPSPNINWEASLETFLLYSVRLFISN